MRKVGYMLVLFTLIGCSGIVKTINGEKKPKVENLESLAEFVDETNLKIDFQNNLFLKNQNAQKLLAKSDLCYVDKDSLIIAYGVMLFNKHWDGINYQDTQACLIDELTENNLIEKSENPLFNILNKEYNLMDLKEVFADEDGESVFPFKKKENPIAIVLWAKYKGKRWAGETNEIIRQLKQSNHNYDIFFLNLDPNKNFSQFEMNKE